jgi:Fic family protein/DNA-binding XRE family transcriptional regulator
MQIPGQLKLIQKISGQSQEKLAADLGVSFATLNSWINGKSSPRPKALARIHELYLKVSGQNVIPSDAISAKKKLLDKRKKETPDIVKKILSRKDLYDQFVLSLTFNSNRIEGSTLSEDETASILFQNIVLTDKSMIEHMEVKNHQAALQYLFKYTFEGGIVDEDLVLKLHSILMNGIQQDAGLYRRHAVRIVGANVVTANYLKVPDLMAKLSKDMKTENKDALAQTVEIHSRFEQIHPFSDGNGRVGRLLMNALLLKNNLAPALIRQEKRKFYMLYLNKSQLEKDFSLLEDFICDAVLEGFALIGNS